ncbi:MAG: helix-turn-helix domain-containing protein [Bacteroidaceae bacterium]|nr:helix-turn-helix domain-containing protein [Bacteroidaceae bacterium]
MQNANNILNNLFSEALPFVETWLRGVVSDEVRKTLDEERQKAKPERNLTRDEVCELLKVSKVTLWKLTKEKKINAITIGRRVLYAESEVKRYLEEG